MNDLPSGYRIAIASSGLGHVTRGIEAWAADLAQGLSARGADVTLFKGGGEAGGPYETVISCFQRDARRTRRLLDCLPRGAWRVGLGDGYGVEQTTFAAGLLRQLRRRRVDVLHVQDSRLALLAQAAARLGLIHAAVVLGHGTNESGDFLQKFRYLQHLSRWQLDEWRRAGVYRPTWTAIPNFVDTNAFCPGRATGMRSELGIPDDACVVLTAAAVKRDHKRIDHLLAEFARLREAAPDLAMWLVVAGGREADTDDLVRQGREALGDRVRFLVQFPRTRMADLYRAADLFVLCSLREMMPIALIEAAASGLPCVTHRHPVLEWITGSGGRAVDMAAPGALAGALAELAADSTGRDRLGAAARTHAVAAFGREQVVAQLLDYYSACVADQRRRRTYATAPV